MDTSTKRSRLTKEKCNSAKMVVAICGVYYFYGTMVFEGIKILVPLFGWLPNTNGIWRRYFTKPDNEQSIIQLKCEK